MSRNLPGYRREHARLQVSRGRCVRCTAAAVPDRRLCAAHLERDRERSRRRFGYQPWRPGGRGTADGRRP